MQFYKELSFHLDPRIFFHTRPLGITPSKYLFSRHTLRKSLLGLLCGFYFNPVSSQNLVPNPSFEDTVSCNPGIEYSLHWTNPTGYSPDYYNPCISSIDYQVPINYYGHQNARTGYAYAGIISAFFGFNGREYIQVELIDSLIGGKKYCVTFFVCVVDSSPFTVHNIGAYFSRYPISTNQLSNLLFQPQVDNNPSLNPLLQQNTWILIEDSFVAAGGEKNMVIGNFNDDATTDTTHLTSNTSVQYGYYFIDDVSLTYCDTTIGITKQESDLISIANFSGKVVIFSSNYLIERIEILDMLGRKLINSSHFVKQIEINTSGLSGLYIVNIYFQSYFIQKKLILTLLNN